MALYLQDALWGMNCQRRLLSTTDSLCSTLYSWLPGLTSKVTLRPLFPLSLLPLYLSSRLFPLYCLPSWLVLNWGCLLRV